MTKKLIGYENEISSLYLNGRSSPEMARLYNVSTPTILAVLRRNGTVIRNASDASRKYKLDQTFFDIIDTAEKAYILGLWAADGYNNNESGSIHLTLADYDLVRDVATAIGTDKPIYIGVSKKKEKIKYTLSLQSSAMSAALTRHGCPQRKSLILEFPSFDMVPKHLIQFYVLGYFDGDGCIHIRKQGKNKVVHIVGTEAFVKGLQSYLSIKTFIHRRSKAKVWFLGIYRLQSINQFRDWIYQDATLFLQRKHAKFFRDFHVAA